MKRSNSAPINTDKFLYRYPCLSVLICGLFAALQLTAQIVPDQFIVQLSEEPSHKTARRGVVRSQQAKVRQAIGIKAKILDSVELVANALIVETKNPDSLLAVPGVLRVYPVQEFQPQLDVMAGLHHVPEAWARIGGQGNAGAGVKIAILDSGIDRDHAGFQDESLPTPNGYPKVSDAAILLALSKKIIVGRSYDHLLGRGPINLDITDRTGHGTAVAMIAAGVTNTGSYGLITGFAPKAYLGVYRISSTGGASTSSILKAMDDAVDDGMDVFNLSFGNATPLRLDLDIVADAIERASAAGVIVIVSGGNYGPGSSTVSSHAAASTAVGVGASNNARSFRSAVKTGDQTMIALAGDGPAPDPVVSTDLTDAATASDPTGTLCLPPPSGAFEGKAVLILRGNCIFQTKLNNAQVGGARAAIVYATEAAPDPFTMSVDGAQLPAMMMSFGNGIKLKNLLKEGSTAVTLYFAEIAIAQPSNQLSEFSSRGPAVNIGIKPDILAVGGDVSTATQSKFPDGGNYDRRGYTVLEGTSFSAPAIAGAMAVVKGARPGLNSAQYRSLIVNSASPMILSNGTVAPVMMAGAGLLDLDAAVRNTTVLAPVTMSFGVGGLNPEMSRMVEVTNLGNESDTFSITIQSTDPLSATAEPATLEIPSGETRKFNLNFQGKDIANGEYQGFVKIKGVNSPVESRMPYWYAAPTYKPATVRIITQSLTGTVNSSQTFGCVLLDATGIPISGVRPEVKVTSGGGRFDGLLSLEPKNPGVWSVLVKLGVSAGPNVFRITSGDANRDVTIEGQ